MNEETLERLESKLAFLERANIELSDVVYRQQREIAALQEHVAALKERIDALKAEPSPYSEADERPPHY